MPDLGPTAAHHRRDFIWSELPLPRRDTAGPVTDTSAVEGEPDVVARAEAIVAAVPFTDQETIDRNRCTFEDE